MNLEKLQIYQNLFLWGMMVFGLLSVICLFGWRHYNTKISQLNNEEIKEEIGKITSAKPAVEKKSSTTEKNILNNKESERATIKKNSPISNRVDSTKLTEIIKPEDRKDYKVKRKAINDFEVFGKILNKTWFEATNELSSEDYQGYSQGYKDGTLTTSRKYNVGIKNKVYRDFNFKMFYEIKIDDSQYVFSFQEKEFFRFPIFEEVDEIDLKRKAKIVFSNSIQEIIK